MCSMRVCMCVVGGCVCVQQVPLDEPLVSQVAGRAVGFLTVTTEMDLSVLDKCFDLEPFHHLRKALPGKGHIPTPTITTPTTPHPLPPHSLSPIITTPTITTPTSRHNLFTF